MFRRILLLLLVMILPLQAIAAVQMGLSACHAKDLGHFQATAPSHAHDHAGAQHDHAQPDHSTADHHEHAGGAALDPCSNCTACDLCVPPLAFTTGLPEHDWSSGTVAGPMPSSNGVIPRSFDRPPRSVPLA